MMEAMPFLGFWHNGGIDFQPHQDAILGQKHSPKKAQDTCEQGPLEAEDSLDATGSQKA